MKWIKVFVDLNAARAAVPHNCSKLVIIGEQRICLSNVGNTFFAIQDLCPHSGHSLSQGKLNYLNEVVCPLHGYRFSLKDGQEGDQKCKNARSFRIKLDETGLFIYI
jgi:nitrite reductase/ring-hydroxylating ferredoxin subunit